MTDAVRLRQAFAQSASGDTNISRYQLHPSNFRVPTGFKVPREMAEAHTELLKVGYQAIGAMKHLKRRREIRYWVLCPDSKGDVYDDHVLSMIRLAGWKQDLDPNDPTLGPSTKIPKEFIKLTIEPLSYFAYMVDYTNHVEEFLAGPWAAWINGKAETEQLAESLKDQFNHRAWRKWWETTFTDAMFKWEVCMEGLVLPSLEDVLDDIYLMLIERVEGGADLADQLFANRPQNANDFAANN